MILSFLVDILILIVHNTNSVNTCGAHATHHEAALFAHEFVGVFLAVHSYRTLLTGEILSSLRGTLNVHFTICVVH